MKEKCLGVKNTGSFKVLPHEKVKSKNLWWIDGLKACWSVSKDMEMRGWWRTHGGGSGISINLERE